jgi:hypothetical protein
MKNSGKITEALIDMMTDWPHSLPYPQDTYSEGQKYIVDPIFLIGSLM